MIAEIEARLLKGEKVMIVALNMYGKNGVKDHFFRQASFDQEGVFRHFYDNESVFYMGINTVNEPPIESIFDWIVHKQFASLYEQHPDVIGYDDHDFFIIRDRSELAEVMTSLEEILVAHSVGTTVIVGDVTSEGSEIVVSDILHTDTSILIDPELNIYPGRKPGNKAHKLVQDESREYWKEMQSRLSDEKIAISDPDKTLFTTERCF